MTKNTAEWTPLDGDYTVFDNPLPWQLRGLQQTASGYGRKLTSSRCVRLPSGQIRRVYITLYGNAGTAWIVLGGARRIVEE